MQLTSIGNEVRHSALREPLGAEGPVHETLSDTENSRYALSTSNRVQVGPGRFCHVNGRPRIRRWVAGG